MKGVKYYQIFTSIKWVFVLGGFDYLSFSNQLKSAINEKDEGFLTVVESIYNSLNLRALKGIYETIPEGMIGVEHLVSKGRAVPHILEPKRILIEDTYEKISILSKLERK